MKIFKVQLKTTNALKDSASDKQGKNYIDVEFGNIFVTENDIQYIMQNYDWEVIEVAGILYQRPTEHVEENIQ